MPIKSKDIAKVLGVSTATVSLAINGKAGVNEETRRKILEYVRELEEEQIQIRKQKTVSKDGCVLFLQYVKHGFIMNQKWETNNSFFSKLEKEVKNSGYQFWCRMFFEKKETIESLLLECKEKKVKGIYIMAAEMQQSDVYPFLSLKVPIVLGDNLVYIEGVDCFLIDNKEGIRRGVDYLVEKGHSDIVYLAETISIYNFLQRREAFVEEMKKQECGEATSRICYLGNTVEEVYEAMKEFLNKKMKRF